MIKPIRLGILGMSAGNGHPYSWSAICNGYNKKYMDECPFPVIPNYLYKQNYPEDFIKEAKVTHIWTQDKKISEHIAHASNIENIVERYEDMIGKVDAILLARDDAENHLEMSRCFLESGMMIYIDKPLAFDLKTAQKILSLEQFEGQIFSCSALRYARELMDTLDKISEIGNISYIEAHTIKSWSTYSAHIVDPVLRIIGDNHEIKEVKKFKNINSQGCTFQLENEIIVSLFAHKNTTITTDSIRIFGDKSTLGIAFGDTFYSFREALKAFLKSVKQKKSIITKKHMLTMVNWIEQGV